MKQIESRRDSWRDYRPYGDISHGWVVGSLEMKKYIARRGAETSSRMAVYFFLFHISSK